MKQLQLIMVALAVALSSCGSNISGFSQKKVKATGTIESRTYKFDGKLKQLDSATGVHVTYKPDAQASQTVVTITTDQAMIEYVKVEKDGDELSIYRDNSVNSNKIEISAVVTGPLFSEYDFSSGASLRISEPLVMDGNVSFDASSGSAIMIKEVRAANVDADASSGASIKISSVIGGDLDVDASSGSYVNAKGIKGCHVDADASSGGSITLAGWAESVSADSSSGGSINRKELKLTQ